MISINNRLAQKKINTHIRATKKKLIVISGKCRYNFRCQRNTVHEALKNKDKKLAMCYCIEGNWGYIHFVNYCATPKGKYRKKKFIDNTLGKWSETVDYYFVKWIREDEFYNINDIFTNYRLELQKELGWWLRLTSNDTF